MKASEAMRQGSENKEQISEAFIKRNEGGAIVGCCGLGAIALAHADKIHTMRCAEIIEKMHPELQREPLNLEHGDTYWEAVVHLNDRAGWTFDQIAAWLEEQGL